MVALYTLQRGNVDNMAKQRVYKPQCIGIKIHIHTGTNMVFGRLRNLGIHTKPLGNYNVKPQSTSKKSNREPKTSLDPSVQTLES